MLFGRRPKTSREEATNSQLLHSQYKFTSTRLFLLIKILMMLSFLRTCRGSRFNRHTASFVTPTNKSGANMNRLMSPTTPSRRLPFSSLARIEYNEEEGNDRMESQQQSKPRRPPRPSLPPPRARRLPPTLESRKIGISNISPEFPSQDISMKKDKETLDYYDPSAKNSQAYGFFTNQTFEIDETNTSSEMVFDEANDDEDTMYDAVDTSMPPVTDAYFNNKYEEDVPNPHNYWGDDDSDDAIANPTDEATSTAERASSPKTDTVTMGLDEHIEDIKEDGADTPLSPVANAYSKNMQPDDAPNPHNYWSDKDAGEATTTVETHSTEHDISIVKEVAASSKESTAPYSPLPKPSMPPRADFPSRPPNDNRADVYVQASSGGAITSQEDMLTLQLNKLEQNIYAQNNNEKFNIKSPKQVSLVLFGKSGLSTNKETLEAIGGAGNVMADLILQYRSLARRISRLDKQKDDESNGMLVKNISASARPSTLTERKEPNDAKGASHNEEAVEGDPLLLVDASAYIWRAYYSMPPLHRKDGMPVGAVLGFCNMLNRLVLSRMLEGECPRLVLVFDAKGKTFRHELYDEYKANRKECPVDLIPQFDLIREAAEAYGIQQLEAPNFEADDVIATLATMALKEGVDANILSGDKDLMQLITPQDVFPSIQMVDPMSMARVSHDVVVSKWGVTPDQLGDVLALAGDAADNIPGVPGIGPKIAASLIAEYGSLDELLEQVDNVKQKARREKLKDNVGNARLSRELVELERELPIDKMTFPDNVSSAAELRMAPMDGERLLTFYRDMGLNDLRRRVEARLNQKKVVRTAKKYKNRRQKAEIPKPEDYKDVPF